jgi:hypothetical protein
MCQFTLRYIEENNEFVCVNSHVLFVMIRVLWKNKCELICVNPHWDTLKKRMNSYVSIHMSSFIIIHINILSLIHLTLETQILVTSKLKQYDGQSTQTQNWDTSDDVHNNYPAFLHPLT